MSDKDTKSDFPYQGIDLSELRQPQAYLSSFAQWIRSGRKMTDEEREMVRVNKEKFRASHYIMGVPWAEFSSRVQETWIEINNKPELKDKLDSDS